MSYVDLGIIGFVVLASLVGLWRGAGKSLIKLLCFVLAVAVCFFISDYCLKFLLGMDVIKQLALGDSWSIRSILGKVISSDSTGIVRYLYEPLFLRYANLGGMTVWGATSDEFLSVAMSLHIFTVVMTVVLYLAARIVASIIGYVLKIIFVHGKPGAISRVIGLIIGAVRGAAIAMFILFIASAALPWLPPVVSDTVEKGNIASVVCREEYKIAAEKLYSDDTIKMMLESAGFSKDSEEPTE